MIIDARHDAADADGALLIFDASFLMLMLPWADADATPMPPISPDVMRASLFFTSGRLLIFIEKCTC